MHQLQAFLRVHARRRFVRQKQTRLGGQGAGDFQAALGPTGQDARLFMQLIAQVHALGQLPPLTGNVRLFPIIDRRPSGAIHQGQWGRTWQPTMMFSSTVICSKAGYPARSFRRCDRHGPFSIDHLAFCRNSQKQHSFRPGYLYMAA